jgi:tetratricopeptide (TPR) repeat protein
LLFLVAASFPAHVAAQESRERAAELLRQGSVHYDRGEYAAALEKFERAGALYPSYRIDFNIATTLEYLGRSAEAAQHFERFLSRASSSAAPEMLESARSSLARIAPQLGRLELRCSEQGAAVLVDGRGAGQTPLEAPIFLGPGSHSLRIQKKGFTDLTKRITLAAGERRVLVLRLEHLPFPDARTAAAAALSAPSAASLQRVASRRYGIWPWAMLGLGLAFTASATVLWSVGISQGNDAYSRYDETAGRPGADLARVDEQRAEILKARNEVLAGSVLLGAGLATLGASLYLFLTRKTSGEFRDPPAVLRLGAGQVALEGSF